MANVKPFKAIRPSSALAAQVAALPYDVYNREEAAESERASFVFFSILTARRHSLTHLWICMRTVFMKKQKKCWTGEIAEGVFVQDEQKCYYLYELTMNGRTQTGITACVSIDDYLHQVVKNMKIRERRKSRTVFGMWMSAVRRPDRFF